jgi:Leucine-rich repeat (LRR) protein
MITVKLILNELFPEKKGVWADGDFAKVQIVSLSNKNVDEIDNLDLFDNITELCLQQNKIQRIENISHLMKLHSLDLSHNLIDEEGLHTERLPPNLKTLKLTGNPCLASNSAMGKLKQDYPHLLVVSESKQSIAPLATSDNRTIPNPATAVSSTENDYLDSESVLRLVVDRKCKLQALVNVNMDSTIQSLEKVCSHLDNNMQSSACLISFNIYLYLDFACTGIRCCDLSFKK